MAISLKNILPPPDRYLILNRLRHPRSPVKTRFPRVLIGRIHGEREKCMVKAVSIGTIRVLEVSIIPVSSINVRVPGDIVKKILLKSEAIFPASDTPANCHCASSGGLLHPEKNIRNADKIGNLNRLI